LPSTQWHQAAPNGTKQHPMAPSSTQWHQAAPNGTKQHPVAPSSTQWHQAAPSGTKQLLGYPDPVISYPHPLILPLFHMEHSPPIVFIIRIILKEDQVDVSHGTYPAQDAYN